MKTPETRAIAELRAETRDDGKPLVVGYAAVFNSWSQDLGGFVERIRPGAFTRALSSGADVLAVVNHNRDLMLGRSTAGTLRLFEDERGLKVEIDPPDSDLARHYTEAVRRGDITGMSFRFYAIKEEWNFDADPAQRELIDVDIDDVSIVTDPAYRDTSAAVRSLEKARGETPRRTPRRNVAERHLRIVEADFGPFLP